MNYYGTREHRERIEDLNERLFSKINVSESPEEKELGEGYTVKSYGYTEDHGSAGVECCAICSLFHNEEFLYEWKNIYGTSRLSNIIHHSDGNDYFLFDEDLYGYSVLNLKTGESMHYIPEESYRKLSAPKETFIWCEGFYDQKTNQMAVDGCYWACPYGVIVVDFSNPLVPVEAKDWIDVLNTDYNGEEICFGGWEDGKLRCKIDDDTKKDTIRIAENLEVVFESTRH